ncbi:MAG: hypothetical protein L6R41_007226 [Letrouitia leprolyta]|nr:MAG: hypothetical protein L6R41_007226 [Letrouitia leprolyta]
MYRLTTCLCLLIQLPLSLSLPSTQQVPLRETNPSPFTFEFDERVLHLLRYWHVPGLSIAVVDGNETFSKGYGCSTFPSVNVTSSTLFYTGSTTKAFTAAALALMIDDTANTSKPLTWTTPISSLIREDFVLPDDYATQHVTLEDAASHRTGLPGHDSSYGGPPFGVRDVVRNLRNLYMTAEIRSKFQYCNMMYITLSHVIETITGTWLGDVFLHRIWTPLNMTQTYLSLDQAKAAAADRTQRVNLAKGYTWNNVTKNYTQVPYMDVPLVSGAGNIISTVDDYALWLHFLIRQTPPLSKPGHASLRHPRTILDPTPLPGFTGTSTYALGWNVQNYHGEPLISHTGGVPGFGSIVGYLPDRKYGIVIFGNTAETAAIVEMTLFYYLLDEYLGIRKEDRGDIESAVENVLYGPKRAQLADPIKALYPESPRGDDAIPLSLPLEKYTGVYHNIGYRNITITISKSEEGEYLHSIIDRTWAFIFDFEHVSGEYFIVKGYPDLPGADIASMDPLEILLLKAEFQVGEDGEVAFFGANLEPQMGEKKIWFRKIEDVA